MYVRNMNQHVKSMLLQMTFRARLGSCDPP